uniref:acyl-CoA dehydrogenase n=1 Tax=Streptomyces hirsutus TaxID=35620 RepID=UPI00343F3885
MSHYLSNLRDIEFNLFELFGRDLVYGKPPFEGLDRDTASSILREVERLATEVLAQSFTESDRVPPTFDPKTGEVHMNHAFAASFHAWLDSEWWRFEIPEEFGGVAAPSTLVWSIAEFMLGANPVIWVYPGFPTYARLVAAVGTERDKLVAQHAVDRRWGVTMVLTEPDAGSDVGAGTTKAYPNDDGTWNIVGVKRFITGAEHDMTENILHMVLARPVGVEGVGGPGTKGLSLFIVPKIMFDLETGELTGERNGVRVASLESKMGIKQSVTCEVVFGGDTPARGWLLGEVHHGIAQMFHIVESARMMVGAKAIATLSTGYLNALDFAKSRIQGADLTRMTDPTAPRVPVISHPDMRRSLLTQKAFAEGLRSLLLYAATWQDDVKLRRHNGEDPSAGANVSDLLLPIVKGYGSERAWTILGTESLQTLGGSGFLQDYPLEQYVRDSKVDTLYEGTTAIQGLDFFFRKVARDGGAALRQITDEITRFTGSDLPASLDTERKLLVQAVDDHTAIVARMLSDVRASKEEPSNIYAVGLNTNRLLFATGDLLVGWLLLRGAARALELAEGATGLRPQQRAFYQGKVAAARHFARTFLPALQAQRRSADLVDHTLAMGLDVEGF